MVPVAPSLLHAFLASICDATSHGVQCGDIITSLLDDSFLWASLLVGTGNRRHFMWRLVIFAIFRQKRGDAHAITF